VLPFLVNKVEYISKTVGDTAKRYYL